MNDERPPETGARDNGSASRVPDPAAADTYAAIPAELRGRDQWVVWRLEHRPGNAKPTKVPYCADGSAHASTTDPFTWGTFDEAVSAAASADGIGYVFTSDDPYCGIDLDEGLSEDDRGAIMARLDSYAETSVSGRGAHVIVRASMNGHARNRRGPLEVYEDGRYFVMTGAHVTGTPLTIEERQAELDEVLATFLPAPAPVEPQQRATVPVDLDDRDLLDKARAANVKFERLWDGIAVGYPSLSEADLALCSMLAFWTGRDVDRIDRLFRSSGLMREKWDRTDYRERTINAAIDGCSETYTPRTSAPTPSAPQVNEPRSRAVDGATFVTSVGDTVPAVWGRDGAVLWAAGEGLMIVGPDGVGKTLHGQRLALARIGLHHDHLGFRVAPATGRVLYIAADRPRQAASSLRRMVREQDHDALRERLIVWKGPLPFDIGNEKTERCALADFAESFEATDVFIDSLKDVAVNLSKDEVGSRVNVAIQETIARGIEVCTNHHQRKASGDNKKPNKLADVYGSRWLTAGMGSVLLLWGDAGDLIVELSHLKQPVEQVGPFEVIYDHELGAAAVNGGVDLAQAVARARGGMTVGDAATVLFGKAEPEPKEIEKARRRLTSLVKNGLVIRQDDLDGTARYFARGAA